MQTGAMKIRNGYMLRKVMDIYLVIGVGAEAYMPTCVMSMNESGACLWDAMREGATEEELVRALLDAFEVDEETAKRDAAAFLEQLRGKDLIEAC